MSTVDDTQIHRSEPEYVDVYGTNLAPDSDSDVLHQVVYPTVYLDVK
ncbi:MAG: hypothetical protein ACSLE6_10745 [Mycobacterium sp.]